ncbi:MAG: bifunctional nuclease domain-containing protein [Bacteroidota bacterium]|jgi:bifunctional DNase/RNase
MSKKIRLDIVALSYSQTQAGAYALVLGEVEGNRRLPIVIGGFEAQAIAIELEKMVPTRPLTHDLFKTFAESFDVSVSEVIIYNLSEGIFYAKLICVRDEQEVEIDARTSDAIALAIRFQCPIYTFDFILSSAGVVLEGDAEKTETKEEESEKEEIETSDSYISKSTAELKDMLATAEDEEQYELAAKIRDELNKRKNQ